jgi:hypothetical protein
MGHTIGEVNTITGSHWIFKFVYLTGVYGGSMFTAEKGPVVSVPVPHAG